MAIELHHLHPGHDDELLRLKGRIAELERMDTEHSLQIAKMNGYISRLEEERRWRKFPDEKPTEDIKFLVINEKGMLQCCYYSTILKEFQIPVTHWMPLPKFEEK